MLEVLLALLGLAGLGLGLMGGIQNSKKPSRSQHHEIDDRLKAGDTLLNVIREIEVERAIRNLHPDKKRQLRDEVQNLLESRDAIRQILKLNPSYNGLSEHDVSAALRAILRLLV